MAPIGKDIVLCVTTEISARGDSESARSRFVSETRPLVPIFQVPIFKFRVSSSGFQIFKFRLGFKFRSSYFTCREISLRFPQLPLACWRSSAGRRVWWRESPPCAYQASGSRTACAVCPMDRLLQARTTVLSFSIRGGSCRAQFSQAPGSGGS